MQWLGVSRYIISSKGDAFGMLAMQLCTLQSPSLSVGLHLLANQWVVWSKGLCCRHDRGPQKPAAVRLQVRYRPKNAAACNRERHAVQEGSHQCQAASQEPLAQRQQVPLAEPEKNSSLDGWNSVVSAR